MMKEEGRELLSTLKRYLEDLWDCREQKGSSEKERELLEKVKALEEEFFNAIVPGVDPARVELVPDEGATYITDLRLEILMFSEAVMDRKEELKYGRLSPEISVDEIDAATRISNITNSLLNQLSNAELLDELDAVYREIWRHGYRPLSIDPDLDNKLRALKQDILLSIGRDELHLLSNYTAYMEDMYMNRRYANEYAENAAQDPENEFFKKSAQYYQQEYNADVANKDKYRQLLLDRLAASEIQIVGQKDRPRLFVDMDGTLARFHDEVAYLERMYEPNFFRELQPFRGAVESVKEFMRQHPDVEVYILSSAIPGNPPGCVQQKQAWLDAYLPEIDHAHRLFPEMGVDKSTVIPSGIRVTDVLLDDYNKNLVEWRQAGGVSVKFVNNINDKALKGERWNGERMYHDAAPKDNAKFLAEMTGVATDPPTPKRGVRL